jgi:hypothetical protein
MRDLFIGDYSGRHDLRDFLTIAIYRPRNLPRHALCRQARRPQCSSIFIAAPRTRAPVVPRRRARLTPACLDLHQRTPALRRASRSQPTSSTPSRVSRSPRPSWATSCARSNPSQTRRGRNGERETESVSRNSEPLRSRSSPDARLSERLRSDACGSVDEIDRTAEKRVLNLTDSIQALFSNWD